MKIINHFPSSKLDPIYLMYISNDTSILFERVVKANDYVILKRGNYTVAIFVGDAMNNFLAEWDKLNANN